MLAWLKGHSWLGSFGKLAAVSIMAASLGTGCGDDPKKSGVAKVCTLNSECEGGLVCSAGLCHKECAETEDCPAGQRCIQAKEANVCQLDQEAKCAFNSNCEPPLVCAKDLQCRNECQTAVDCLNGQKCADGVCAEPSEVDDMGGLKGAVDQGGGGEGGGPSTVDPGAGGEGGAPDVTPPTCTPGGACAPQGQPCKTGMITCDGNTETCTVAGDEDDGTECGTDMVCSTGACVACAVGEACQPDANNVCAAGTRSCAVGPACDAAGDAPNGTECGTDQVCSGGTCVGCVEDAACNPPNQPCKNGELSCASGPVCNATTNKGAGTNCGTDQVCNSIGACLACVQDGPCTPSSNDCSIGKMDCATGPNCVETASPAPDGQVCDGPNTYDFCSGGQCVACQNGNPCVPTTNACKKGTLNCGTAPPTCNESVNNADDGTICGDNKSCIGGGCVDNDRKLSTPANPAAVAIDAPFATVSVTLLDKNDMPVPATPITVVASAGAFAQASNTNASGVSQISGRVGRAIGAHTFTVSAPGATSVQFTVNSVAPTAKNIFTLVNVTHLSGTATPGPGTVSKLYYDVPAIAAATDGTLYFSSYCAVFKLSTEGVLTRIAGDANETCGNTGDSGLATGARVYYVTGLALDEENEYLYLADSYNYRVRQIDLSTTRPSAGKIFAFAGGGANTGAPYGDDGPADAAYMYPSGVAVGPNGDVYISDNNANRIRKVDFVTSEITTAIPNGSCDANNPITLLDCGGPGDGCGMAWNKDGKLFISGQLCVHGVGSFKGIARVEANGSLVHLAGNTGTNVAEGGAAKSATFYWSPAITFDKAGNLYLASRYENRVRRIDSATQHIDTVAGNGTAAYVGDYVAGTASQLNYPSSIAFDGAGNLYIADSTNYAIRSLWAQGNTVAPTCKLATLQGGGQTVKVDAPFAALAVKLTDGANVAIQGVDVAWKRLETGSGLGSTGLPNTLNTTNAQGNSSMTGRVGLATGDYKFEASYSDLHGTPATDSPQTFTVAAEAPAAGIIFPVMNYVHTSGLGGVPGPATFAKMQSYTLGVQAGSDGTIYAADGCAVYAITPRGEASVFAGTPGSCGFAGDSGPAVGAKLYYPYGMALDETAGYLYIADNGNQRVRMVSLSTGVIDTLAGGGSVSTEPFGDGGPAVDANIGAITSVSVDDDGNVYIPDPTHHRIRVVDPLGNIDSWLDGTYPNGCTNGVVSLYYVDQFGSAVRFNTDGSAYISGQICEGTSTSSTLGIILRAADGNTFTRIAGLAGGITTENADAIATLIPDMGDFIVEGNGNLVFSTHGNHMVRRISGGKVNTIGGVATNYGYGAVGDVSANAGNYVAASTVRFYNPLKLAVTPAGHLLVADEYNYAIRMIW